MAKINVKPLTSGGGTLAKMIRGQKNNGKPKQPRKATWFECFGKKSNDPYRGQSWPQGEMPEELRMALDKTKK